jgi:hypothetical protein
MIFLEPTQGLLPWFDLKVDLHLQILENSHNHRKTITRFITEV